MVVQFHSDTCLYCPPPESHVELLCTSCLCHGSETITLRQQMVFPDISVWKVFMFRMFACHRDVNGGKVQRGSKGQWNQPHHNVTAPCYSYMSVIALSLNKNEWDFNRGSFWVNYSETGACGNNRPCRGGGISVVWTHIFYLKWLMTWKQPLITCTKDRRTRGWIQDRCSPCTAPVLLHSLIIWLHVGWDQYLF